MFIIVSTFFLMPIRLIGFFRMAHASGWGTRAGAYAGGPAEISSDEEIAQHTQAEVRVRSDARRLPDSVGGMTTATALATRDAARDERRGEGRRQGPTAPTKPARRRLNPLAAIPYLIGIAILTLEALFLV